MPIPVAVLAALAAAAASAGSSAYASSRKKSQEKGESKLRSKEMKRETYADLISDAEKRETELEGHHLSNKSRKSKKRSGALMETASNLREALKI